MRCLEKGTGTVWLAFPGGAEAHLEDQGGLVCLDVRVPTACTTHFQAEQMRTCKDTMGVRCAWM